MARFRQAGAFAEMVTAPEKAVVLKPVDLSYERAAALPTVGVTAYQATAEVRPGQAVFVSGCLGGVGRAAVQFARARGASVAGSCRDTAADEALELGVEPVVGRLSTRPPSRNGSISSSTRPACFPSPRPERC